MYGYDMVGYDPFATDLGDLGDANGPANMEKAKRENAAFAQRMGLRLTAFGLGAVGTFGSERFATLVYGYQRHRGLVADGSMGPVTFARVLADHPDRISLIPPTPEAVGARQLLLSLDLPYGAVEPRPQPDPAPDPAPDPRPGPLPVPYDDRINPTPAPEPEKKGTHWGWYAGGALVALGLAAALLKPKPVRRRRRRR